MSEPLIVHAHTPTSGVGCTGGPAGSPSVQGAGSAGSYAGAEGELVAWLRRPEVARGVARSLVRELRRMPRDGVGYPGWASPVLRCLRELALVDGGSDVAPVVGTVGDMSEAVSQGWLPVSRAAAGCGRSVAHVRRLVSSGRVRGTRASSRLWLVDPVSLRSVISVSGLKAGGGAP